MADVRPIDANALLERIRLAKEGCEEDGKVAGLVFANAMLNVLETDGVMPTIDYAPVRHGEWVARKEIFDGEQEPVDAIGCSQCGKSQRLFRRTPYCPNCGAKMDGGARR